MVNAEQVVIDILANDKASSTLEGIRGKLEEISLRAKNITSSFNNITNIPEKVSEKINKTTPKIQQPASPYNRWNLPQIKDIQTKLNEYNEKSAPKIIPKLEIPKVDTKDIQTKFQANGDLRPKIPATVNIPKGETESVTREIQSRLDAFKGTQINVDTSQVDNYGSAAQKATQTAKEGFDDVSKSVKDVDKSVNDSTKTIGKYSNYSYNSFEKVNTLLASMSTQFGNISTAIAGIFGANSLSGMIEKMWTGATERQTNMLFLMHQKGVDQANQYYDEIMNIVTQLPGDDTFLTNILNMTSALDDSIDIDNLREMGQAITDYYIASTMKGELPFETERDIRKYLTTGETRPLNNSLLANEIDLLKDRNTILERGQALQEALDKNGFSGMSGYESATNELEEFKGHFQKAFSDIGGIITSVTQPLMKFYNTLDRLLDSRLSQGVILLAVAFIGLFSALSLGSLMLMMVTRTIQIVGELNSIIAELRVLTVQAGGAKQFLAAVTADLVGVEGAELAIRTGNIPLIISETYNTIKLNIAKRLNIEVNKGETVSLLALFGASLNVVKTKVLQIGITIKNIIFGVQETAVKDALRITETYETLVAQGENLTKLEQNILLGQQNVLLAANIRAKLSGIKVKITSTLHTIYETTVEILRTVATEKSTFSDLKNIVVKQLRNHQSLKTITYTLKEIKVTLTNAYGSMKEAGAELFKVFVKGNLNAITSEGIVIKILEAIAVTGVISVTVTDAGVQILDATGKEINTVATLGLTVATGLLSGAMALLEAPIVAITVAILGVVVIVEKLGEAFGWWEGFSEMVGAIADGVNRLWGAFINSEPIQGIIQYFTDFASVIQYLWESILGFFSILFGWGEDTGTLDIIQSIIDAFGALGGAIKWVWNLLDDFSNSPLGIITWLNPLTILIFHLDEIGSLFEDIGDAINRFLDTPEFEALSDAFNDIVTSIQEPFQEIWDLIQEILSIFGEIFGTGEDPEGNGTEDRINGLVEAFKILANVIRILLIPLRLIGLVIKAILTPIRILLTVIRAIGEAIKWVTNGVDLFGAAWAAILAPLTNAYNFLKTIYDIIVGITNAIKNSPIGKLFGWDKDNDDDDKPSDKYAKQFDPEHQYKQYNKYVPIYDETRRKLTGNDVNNINNLGRTYNNTDNQRQVVINQNFSEGSMPIDARNMTKKEAKQMFIGAFGYNRSVGSKGILR